MAPTVTKTNKRVVFGPVCDWGKKSVVVCGGSQYTLEDCSRWVNDGKFAELEKASQRTRDLQSFGEADRLEFMSRGVAERTLDLDQAGSWEIIQQGMIMQEVFANDVQVEMIEAEDTDYHYKTMTAISTTRAVQKEWQTPRAKRVTEVLPSSPDPITVSQRELQITPTPDRKRLRAFEGSTQEADRLRCRMLKFDGIPEESDDVMEEEDAEVEGMNFPQVQYEDHEIPDTQDEDAPLIKTWDPTMFFMILERGMIYLKSNKLTRGETEAVEDLMAAAYKTFDHELFRSMVIYDGQFTSNIRKGVAKMDNYQIREEHLLIMYEC